MGERRLRGARARFAFIKLVIWIKLVISSFLIHVESRAAVVCLLNVRSWWETLCNSSPIDFFATKGFIFAENSKQIKEKTKEIESFLSLPVVP